MIVRRSLVFLLPAAALSLAPVAAADEPPLTPVGPAVVRGDGRVDLHAEPGDVEQVGDAEPLDDLRQHGVRNQHSRHAEAASYQHR